MTDGERERWRRALAWHRDLLEKIAAEFDRLAQEPGRTPRDRAALKRRAARIREHLFHRDRDPFVPV